MPRRGPYDVAISNSQRTLDIDAAFVRDVVSRTLTAENVDNATISIAIVDNATIHELNRRHLSHDYETDVLSFLLDCEQTAEPAAPDSPRGEGKTLDGEIIVSAEMAAQRADEFGWSASDELALYIVHGLLHVAGYDDTTDSERLLMRQREREILSDLGIQGHEESRQRGGE